MADFVAVLRKTIGALGENTPEMREKVFDKARATIEMKLAAIEPPPPAAVVDRQRKALEDANAVVRADYAAPGGSDGGEDLEDVFASLKSMGDVKIPPPPPTLPPVQPVLPRATLAEPDLPRPASPPPPAPSLPRGPEASAPPAPDPVLDAVEEEAAPKPEAAVAAARQRREAAKQGSGRRNGLIAALALLLVVAGGGYGVWLNKDDLFGSSPPPSSPVAAEEEGVTTAEELVEAEPEDEASEQDIAALPPAEEEAEAPTPPQPAAAEPVKFTQRLLPDGNEVDEGPAGGPRTIGEGTSVAAVAQTPPSEPDATATDAGPEAAAPEASAEPAAETAAARTQPPAVPVGQRAIFYEERTSSAQGSAEMGSIVWSIVQEPPGGDLPPEAAIRAEATVPGKDVQLRMTIRRNGDRTLPASHIVEMIFLTPDGFEGGAIANVSRISFKETEQAAGNPLLGIPAKIADGFFLIALGDAPAEVEANMTLLGRQSWVDIPIVYQTGRRALLSLEKGIPGERVFQEAIQAWSEASSG